MKVFVITEEPYHDNSFVMGASLSLEKAVANASLKYSDLDWKYGDAPHSLGCYANVPNLVAWTKVNDVQIDELFIYAFEVDLMSECTLVTKTESVNCTHCNNTGKIPVPKSEGNRFGKATHLVCAHCGGSSVKT